VLAVVAAVLGFVLRTPNLDMPIKQFLRDRQSLLLVGLFATTLGPICEELIFRGFVLPLLARSLGEVAGVLAAALPFALLHGPQYSWSWRHILLVTLAGAAFGWVRLRTGSTIAAATIHGSYNLTFFIAFLSTGKG
jgi:membrane protease YdiL (CAAX protease family)